MTCSLVCNSFCCVYNPIFEKLVYNTIILKIVQSSTLSCRTTVTIDNLVARVQSPGLESALQRSAVFIRL